jgi:hypothetical protein
MSNDMTPMTDPRAEAKAAAEKQLRIALQKAADMAALQIEVSRGVLARQGLPESPEAVLQVAQMVAINWADRDRI